MITLKLGHIELIPIHRDFSSYKEFLDWTDSLSDGLRKSSYKESKYIMSLKKLGIFENIKNNYSVSLVSEITLQVEDDFGFSRNGLSVLIDDPIEVEKFINGEDAVGYDEDAVAIDLNRDHTKIIDWSGESSILFIVRTI
jgi:hypothetical protein